MRQWSVTIKNFHKGRYWNNERTLSVKANRIDAASRRAVTRYLEELPKGTRIEGLNISIQAIKKAKPAKDFCEEFFEVQETGYPL